MRTTKFRGIPVGEKDYVYGYYRYCEIRNWIGSTPYQQHKIYDPLSRIEHDVQPDTVAQFTGCILNEKELYEGDKLTNESSDSEYVIKWSYNYCYSLIQEGKDMGMLCDLHAFHAKWKLVSESVKELV